MKIVKYKVRKSDWKKEWGEIPYWVLWVLWTRKDSAYQVGISTPQLNYADHLYILPTIDYENLVPAGDARKTYNHWRLSLSFLKWRATLLDWQWSPHVEEESEII